MGVSYKDRLEGGYQFVRIRKFKAWTAAGLILATSGLVAVSLAEGGATARPLYFPVEAFLPALLVMFLIGLILEMFFRTLSIKYAKKDGQRYLMVQGSISRAKLTIAITNMFSSQVTFSYLLDGHVFPGLFAFVPGIAIALAIACLMFIFYLRPRREKFKQAAIYSGEFKTRIDSGERLYSEYTKISPDFARAVPEGNPGPMSPAPAPAVSHNVPPYVPPPAVANPAPRAPVSPVAARVIPSSPSPPIVPAPRR